MRTKEHWERVYGTTDPTKVGWYQEHPELCLKLIASVGLGKESPILDVGGGASLLVDELLDLGYENLTVLDISITALEHAKSRLGERAHLVTWVDADITQLPPTNQFDLWHDRAVFHFLTDTRDRRKYVKALSQALSAGGHLVIGAFALNAPPRCSGLPVVRYSEQSLSETLGESFELREVANETHVTPSGKQQEYLFLRFSKRPS
jgi:SAM-dependent methyltransferase